MAHVKTKKPDKHCRIFGVGATGPLAGVFPDIVAFSFEIPGVESPVDAAGFTATE